MFPLPRAEQLMDAITSGGCIAVCKPSVEEGKPAGCASGCGVPGGAVTHVPTWRERGIALLCVCATQSENGNQEEKKREGKEENRVF